MINKHFNKTPYEIWYGKIPKVSYFRIFGCKCFIHNNGKDHLTAFDAKEDVGIILGYSSVSKAYRVFNKRTLTVEESTHVVFEESFEIIPNEINELSNRLEATNLQSNNEDEIQIHRNNTLDSPLNQTDVVDIQPVSQTEIQQAADSLNAAGTVV